MPLNSVKKRSIKKFYALFELKIAYIKPIFMFDYTALLIVSSVKNKMILLLGVVAKLTKDECSYVTRERKSEIKL